MIDIKVTRETEGEGADANSIEMAAVVGHHLKGRPS